MEPGVFDDERVYPDGSFAFHCHLFCYRDLGRRVRAGARVLDLACGDGYGTAELAARATAVGLDYVPGVVATARARYPDAHFLAGNAFGLPFADATFDVVAALQIIEHVLPTEDFVAELARVLKPDGFAYLATPNIDRLPALARKEFNQHHVRDFTPADLEAALKPFFTQVELFGQVLAPSPKADRLHAAADVEWRLMPKVERVEALVRRLPGPLRVRLRRALLRASGIPHWPTLEAEEARGAITAEDFEARAPAEASGNTIAIARGPRAR